MLMIKNADKIVIKRGISKTVVYCMINLSAKQLNDSPLKTEY